MIDHWIWVPPSLLGFVKFRNFQSSISLSFLIQFDFFTPFLETSERARKFWTHFRCLFTMKNGPKGLWNWRPCDLVHSKNMDLGQKEKPIFNIKTGSNLSKLCPLTHSQTPIEVKCRAISVSKKWSVIEDCSVIDLNLNLNLKRIWMEFLSNGGATISVDSQKMT